MAALYSRPVPLGAMPYLAPKLLYTFLFACQGSAPVYLALFYSSQLGLKGDQIGLLVAIAPFISAIACPLWAAIADKTKTHSYIICGSADSR
ncbi:hypothetical protein G6F42_016683 [Rhizopus arrhizus]|nr:hypothetical protein G6F42_016683 [Rhizopus arrhizus]